MPSAWAFRPVRSVAISTVPLPTKGSRTRPLRLEQSLMAFDTRVIGLTVRLRSVYASIVPNIRTRPAMLTKLDRVDMRRTAVLPYERRRGNRMSGKALSDDSARRKTGGDGRTRACTLYDACLLYTSPSPRDGLLSRMPS